MKKKKIITLSLILVVFICVLIFIVNNNTSSIRQHNNDKEVISSILSNDKDIEDIINQLCSNECLSRAIGSEENVNASNFIKSFFESYKIKPLIDGNYFNSIDLDVSTFNNNAQTKELNNICAVIKGNNSKDAIFVTAHFDHLPMLTGAIDNASGTSVMLEVAHKISEYCKNNKLDTDIVFIAFNAEEMGLKGSIDFLTKYSNLYDNYYNINIDCVGYNNSEELAMGNNHSESKELYSSFIESLKKNNIKYNNNIYASDNGIVKGTSDHQVFRMCGHPALVLGNDNIFEIVHTTEDTIDKVDIEYLNKLSNVITEFIIENNGNMFN